MCRHNKTWIADVNTAPMKTYHNISLLPYNTFGIDVKASRLLVLEDGDEVPVLEKPYLVLGSGSDVVFTRDYEGTVLVLSPDASSLRICPEGGDAPAGMLLDDLIQWTLEHGLYGMENLSAIPGTVGASVVQNVGAYGVEIKDIVSSVCLFDMQERHSVVFSADQCRFAYRTSIFKQQPGRWLVQRVVYRLGNTFIPNLSYKALEGLPHTSADELRQAIIHMRWQKLPRPEEYGSAGSFFKNPVVDDATFTRLKSAFPDMPSYPGNKLSAGWLIDQCGWKGRTIGRVGVWPRQALVLYNTGGCSGLEVVELATAIRQDVFNKFGVTLDPEAIII